MNRLKIFFLLFFFSAVSQAYVGLCCGKCGGNMPMNIPGGGVPETHEFRFKVSTMLMNMDGLRNGTDNVEVNDILGMPVMLGQPTGKYMAAPLGMDMNMNSFMAGYSFSDDFFAGLMLMHTQNSMNMRFNSTMQTATGLPGFTMKSSGIADSMLMTKYRLFTDDPLIPTSQASFLFALSLPTGSIDERNVHHPVAMRRNELLPYGMQLGSGTFDPTIGILYQGSSSPYWWGANLSYTARLYDNKRDYRLGNETRLDLYGMYQLRHDFLTQLQLNFSYKGKIKGEMNEALSGESGRVTQGDSTSPYMTPLWDTANTGNTKLMATLGLQWQPTSLQILDLSIGVPLYTKTTGIQLEEKYRVMLTWFVELTTSKSRRYLKNKGTLGF
jgi:hypothetical protein